MFSLSGCRGGGCEVWFCAWGSWSGCGCGVGCGGIVGWCDCQFCGSCDKDIGDVELVVIDSGPSQESFGYCDNKFAWCQDMVENGFVYVVADK